MSAPLDGRYQGEILTMYEEPAWGVVLDLEVDGDGVARGRVQLTSRLGAGAAEARLVGHRLGDRLVATLSAPGLHEGVAWFMDLSLDELDEISGELLYAEASLMEGEEGSIWLERGPG